MTNGKTRLSDITLEDLRKELATNSTSSGVIRKKSIVQGWHVAVAIIAIVGGIAWAIDQWDAKADVAHVNEVEQTAKREREEIREGVVEVQVQSVQSHEHLKRMIERVHPEARGVPEPKALQKAKIKAARTMAEEELFQ